MLTILTKAFPSIAKERKSHGLLDVLCNSRNDAPTGLLIPKLKFGPTLKNGTARTIIKDRKCRWLKTG